MSCVGSVEIQIRQKKKAEALSISAAHHLFIFYAYDIQLTHLVAFH